MLTASVRDCFACCGFPFHPSCSWSFFVFVFLAGNRKVWATNNARHLAQLREELFPNWGLSLIGEWYWVKVCTTGELVFPLDSPHKKPFERVLIGRFGKRKATTPASVTVVERGGTGGTGGTADGGRGHGGAAGSNQPQHEPAEVPGERVLLSVPCSQHSRKPPLGALLAPYLPAGYVGLEVFARNLLPGWTSFGNEVLKFNQLCSDGLVPC